MSSSSVLGAPAQASTDVAGRFRAGAARLIREPLLQFLLIGALIFVVAHVVERQRQTAERQILIDETVIAHLITMHELQMGQAPSPQRIKSLIEDYVRDEVRYREALRMGLDQDDEIVRRRLIQKIDFLNRDLSVPTEPDEAALRGYYDAHAADFTEAPRLSFRHVYFSPDAGGSEAARRRAEDALRRLSLEPAAVSADVHGDRFALNQAYAELSPHELAQVFGQFPIVNGLQNAVAGQWRGPLQSGYGWHLVFVTQRHEAHVPPFERVREAVKTAWTEQQRSRGNRDSFDQLRRRYEVVRADRSAQP